METKNNVNMNMRPAPKKDDNNGLLGGALGAAIGTAFGAVFGVGGAYAYSKITDDSDNGDFEVQFTPEADQEVAIADHPEPPHHTHHHDIHHVHHTHDVYVVNNNPDTILAGGGGNGGNIIQTNNPGGGGGDPEVRVLSYERVNMEDGSQMDVATVSINGQEAAIVDVDLDGWADGMIADMNNDGNISEDEITSFEGTDVRIEMSPLAQAANYDPDDVSPVLTDGSDVVMVDNDITGDDTDDNEELYPDWEEGNGGEDPGIVETDDDLILASNETDSSGMPDYVNDGDVSDLTMV